MSIISSDMSDIIFLKIIYKKRVWGFSSLKLFDKIYIENVM